MAVAGPMQIGPGTELGLQAASGDELLFVGSPHRARGAGVADGTRLVHRAEGEWMLHTAEQAVDLDARAVLSGDDRDVPHATASDLAARRDAFNSAGLDDRHWSPA